MNLLCLCCQGVLCVLLLRVCCCQGVVYVLLSGMTHSRPSCLPLWPDSVKFITWFGSVWFSRPSLPPLSTTDWHRGTSNTGPLVQFDVRCSAHKVTVGCHLSEPAGPKAKPTAGGKYKWTRIRLVDKAMRGNNTQWNDEEHVCCLIGQGPNKR